MTAEVASAAGIAVDVYESKGSVGRKLLIAGKGGLNLTHSEDQARFVSRYGACGDRVAEWLTKFNANDVRAWSRGLGIETFIGSSGRVFPSDMKAAPLLRAWVHRLRAQGVRFHVRHRCIGLSSCVGLRAQRELHFETPNGEQRVTVDAVVLSMGGGSWPQLGSDGQWVQWLDASGVSIATLEPANCGFDAPWSDLFAQRYAGHPVKSVIVSTPSQSHQGEFVVTSTGVEGSVIYALSAQLRESIRTDGVAILNLDLAPDRTLTRLQAQLSKPRKGRTLTEHLRRSVGIEGVKAGLLHEVLSKESLNDMRQLAVAIKSLPLRLVRTRPLSEAISTAGGVDLRELDRHLMIEKLPGVFCTGEMLDWEAPTGGYLLTACLASGRVAGQGAAQWLSG